MKTCGEVKTYSCQGCLHGVKMCMQQPCRATPEEILTIICAGHGDKLMLDCRPAGWDTERLPLLRPAIVGHEQAINTSYNGKCTFLTKDLTCGIQKMKPLEGRAACCKVSNDDVLDVVEKTWDNPDAQALVEAWKEQFLNA